MATCLSAAERDCDFGEDRISGLPDDIILNFFSSLTMKEAAKTSIVSKRWRYLWANRTHLDFDYSLLELPLTALYGMYSYTAAQKDKYVNWVNQVLDLHCSPCIETFRVSFLFGSSYVDFDKWVKFALLRKVKNLKLSSDRYDVVYTLGFDVLKPPVGIGGITSLTSLHLNRVDVSGDFIEFLLSKCRHLERLYVGYSSLLVRLKVIGLSCKLKHLSLHWCDNLEELEIDALNLMYFYYVGRNRSTNLVLKRMPMLVEAVFGLGCFGSPVSIFHQISHLAAQIYKLSLKNKVNKFPNGDLPKFFNLKHLNLGVNDHRCYPFDITLWLEACPVLHELKLEIFWFSFEYGRGAYLPWKLDLCWDDIATDLKYSSKTHQNLKLFEVVGYKGHRYDVDIILSIIHLACNLETILFDHNRSDARGVETSRARAYKLKKIIPPKIRVIII